MRYFVDKLCDDLAYLRSRLGDARGTDSEAEEEPRSSHWDVGGAAQGHLPQEASHGRDTAPSAPSGSTTRWREGANSDYQL